MDKAVQNIQHIMQALRRGGADPATTDRLLQTVSGRAPFYPDDPSFVRCCIVEKENGTALDAHLRQAAALSAPLRQAALARGRAADRQGVFTTIVLPNRENPAESLVVKVQRSAAVGAGFGTFGGIVEPGEYDGTATGLINALLRECREESREVMDIGTSAQLLAVLQRAHTVPLFTCRDDSHVIDRGWGWTVDANAHVSVVDDPNDQMALIGMLRLCGIAPDQHIGNTAQRQAAQAAETVGLALFSLRHAPRALASLVAVESAPDSIVKHHYGHEALGEIAAVEKALQLSSSDYPVRAHYLAEPQIIPFVAGKMRIKQQSVLDLLQQVADGKSGGGIHVPPTVYQNTPQQIPSRPACDG